MLFSIMTHIANSYSIAIGLVILTGETQTFNRVGAAYICFHWSDIPKFGPNKLLSSELTGLDYISHLVGFPFFF